MKEMNEVKEKKRKEKLIGMYGSKERRRANVGATVKRRQE
jgi:hypothetical protein